MSLPPPDPSRPVTPPTGPQETTPYQAPPTYPAWSAASGPETAQPVPPPTRRGGPVRWAVAIVVTLVIVVGAAALAFVAIGARTTTALGPSYLPATTVAYMEARLDLPGDQRQRLVEFIGRFPGFEDPSSFDRKIDDTLDRFLTGASQGRITYTRDIEPWFTGEVSMGVTAPPDLGADPGSLRGQVAGQPLVIGLGVSDRAALDRFLMTMRAEATDGGSTFTESLHGTSTIVTWHESGPSQPTLSYTSTDQVLLVAAAEEQLRGALDVLADVRPSLAEAEAFTSRIDALPAERLGAVYMDLAFLRQAIEQGLQSAPGASPGLAFMDLDVLPTHFLAALRAEGDRIVLDARVTPGPATPALSVRSTTLAERMPAGTLYYAESRDVGRILQMTIAQIKAQLGDAVPDSQLRQVEGFLGTPVEDFLTWIADAGIGVSMEGDVLLGGMVATVTDESLAVDRVARLTAAISAASMLGEAPFTVADETVGEARLTTIAFGGPSLPGDLPFKPSLSYAVHDGVFYLGLSDFVRGAVQRGAADSLASTDAYRSALEAAGGTENSGSLYLDVASIRSALERLIPEEERAGYDNIQPYLAPLDRLVAVGTSTEGDIAVRILIFAE